MYNVRFVAGDEAVHASADECSLEDVITHILQNAQRYRPAEREITITLAAIEAQATVTITNIGPAIDDALIDKIFEYGVSGTDAKPGGTTHAGNRGQGLRRQNLHGENERNDHGEHYGGWGLFCFDVGARLSSF